MDCALTAPRLSACMSEKCDETLRRRSIRRAHGRCSRFSAFPLRAIPRQAQVGPDSARNPQEHSCHVRGCAPQHRCYLRWNNPLRASTGSHVSEADIVGVKVDEPLKLVNTSQLMGWLRLCPPVAQSSVADAHVCSFSPRRKVKRVSRMPARSEPRPLWSVRMSRANRWRRRKRPLQQENRVRRPLVSRR